MGKITGSNDAQRKYNGVFLEDLVKHSNHRVYWLPMDRVKMAKWLAHGRHSQSILNTDEASLSRLASSTGIVRDQLSQAHRIVLKRKLLSSLTNTLNGLAKSGRATEFWNSETGRKELFWSNELVRDFLEGDGAVGAESVNDVSGQDNAVRYFKPSSKLEPRTVRRSDEAKSLRAATAPTAANVDAATTATTTVQSSFPRTSLFQHPQRAILADDSMLLDPTIPLEVQAFRNETQQIATKLANDRRDFQAEVSVVGQEIQQQFVRLRAEMERLTVDRRVEEERGTAEAQLAFEAQVAAEERRVADEQAKDERADAAAHRLAEGQADIDRARSEMQREQAFLPTPAPLNYASKRFSRPLVGDARQGLEKSMFSPTRSINIEPYQQRLEALLHTSSSTVPDDESEIDGQFEERCAIEHDEDPRCDFNSRTYSDEATPRASPTITATQRLLTEPNPSIPETTDWRPAPQRLPWPSCRSPDGPRQSVVIDGLKDLVNAELPGAAQSVLSPLYGDKGSIPGQTKEPSASVLKYLSPSISDGHELECPSASPPMLQALSKAALSEAEPDWQQAQSRCPGPSDSMLKALSETESIMSDATEIGRPQLTNRRAALHQLIELAYDMISCSWYEGPATRRRDVLNALKQDRRDIRLDLDTDSSCIEFLLARHVSARY
ncbi:hypothetical protein Focb16_v003465 [Fusarium oxysporum f. sp. cubense]|uniref:Uncharacterized protein n=1 Tax=Fusarium oxysporum f. sp. cubense TaxID=61366 RepID=A0A559KMF6_FUSOC|nr:hypothetical protein Focb16_v003465 [Fusarium oxysporum f. sp. cubense]